MNADLSTPSAAQTTDGSMPSTIFLSPNTMTRHAWVGVLYVREGAITHQDNLGNKGRT